MPTIRKERVASDGSVGPSGDRASQTSMNWKAIKAAQKAAKAAGIASPSGGAPATSKDSGAAFGSDMSAEESAAAFAPPPPPIPPGQAVPTAAPGQAPSIQQAPARPKQHGAACDAPGCSGTRPAAAPIPLCRACTLAFTRELNADPSYRQVRDRVLADWISARQLADAIIEDAEAQEEEEAAPDA